MSELSAPHTKSRNFCLPIQRQLNPSTIRFARAATYAIFFGDGLGFGVWAGFLVGPPLIGTLASLSSLPAALSLVIVFGLIIANSARHAVAGP